MVRDFTLAACGHCGVPMLARSLMACPYQPAHGLCADCHTETLALIARCGPPRRGQHQYRRRSKRRQGVT